MSAIDKVTIGNRYAIMLDKELESPGDAVSTVNLVLGNLFLAKANNA